MSSDLPDPDLLGLGDEDDYDRDYETSNIENNLNNNNANYENIPHNCNINHTSNENDSYPNYSNQSVSNEYNDQYEAYKHNLDYYQGTESEHSLYSNTPLLDNYDPTNPLAFDTIIDDIYSYYTSGGYARTVFNKISDNLLFLFAFLLSVVCIIVVKWSDVFFCSRSSKCVILEWHNLTHLFSFHSFFYLWATVYILFATFFITRDAFYAWHTIRRAQRIAYSFGLLGITDCNISLITWRDVVTILQSNAYMLFGIDNYSDYDSQEDPANPHRMSCVSSAALASPVSYYSISQRLCRVSDVMTALFSSPTTVNLTFSLSRWTDPLVNLNTPNDATLASDDVHLEVDNNHELNNPKDGSSKSLMTLTTSFSYPPVMEWIIKTVVVEKTLLHLQELSSSLTTSTRTSTTQPLPPSSSLIKSASTDALIAPLVSKIRNQVIFNVVFTMLFSSYLLPIALCRFFIKYAHYYRTGNKQINTTTSRSDLGDDDSSFNTPYTASSLLFSSHARYLYRNFLELDHHLNHRLNKASNAVSYFFSHLPSSPALALSKALFAIISAVLVFLLILTITDTDILSTHYLFGKNLLFHIAFLTVLLTIISLPKEYTPHHNPYDALLKVYRLLMIAPVYSSPPTPPYSSLLIHHPLSSAASALASHMHYIHTLIIAEIGGYIVTPLLVFFRFSSFSNIRSLTELIISLLVIGPNGIVASGSCIDYVIDQCDGVGTQGVHIEDIVHLQVDQIAKRMYVNQPLTTDETDPVNSEEILATSVILDKLFPQTDKNPYIASLIKIHMKDYNSYNNHSFGLNGNNHITKLPKYQALLPAQSTLQSLYALYHLFDLFPHHLPHSLLPTHVNEIGVPDHSKLSSVMGILTDQMSHTSRSLETALNHHYGSHDNRDIDAIYETRCKMMRSAIMFLVYYKFVQ